MKAGRQRNTVHMLLPHAEGKSSTWPSKDWFQAFSVYIASRGFVCSATAIL
jgi:hypothetical protein